MLKKFLPRETKFFDFFEKHAALTKEAARELVSFGDMSKNREEIFKNIKFLEHEADVVTHQCIEGLHRTFITPIERTDIHRLISKMDDVIDEIEDVGKLVVLYKIEKIQKEALALAQIIEAATTEIQASVFELRKLKSTDAMKQHFINVHQLENEADALLIQALSRLFDEEKNAIQIIKWKEVYEHLEKTTDSCEDVANILEGILLEYE